MGVTLRNIGLGLLAGWLLLLGAEHFGMARVPWDRNLLQAGIALTLIGLTGQLLSGRRREGSIRGGRCVRCNKRIRTGQIYCEEHAKQAIRQTQHEGVKSRGSRVSRP